MIFTCTKENISRSLDIVGGIASKHANLPILGNILINVTESKVTLVATNLEIAICTTLRAKIDKPGSFTVPAKMIIDFVHLLPDEQVKIDVQDNELLLTCGSSSTKIKGIPADEYPVVPKIEEQHPYIFDINTLKNGLSRTVIAVAKNEIRPELSGLYARFFPDGTEGLVCAATDSYRLAESKISVVQGTDIVSCIIPAKTVYEMVRLLTLGKSSDGETGVHIWVSDTQIAMRYDSFEMTSRLVDGTYPDYTQIIPQAFKTTADMPVDVLINKIKAASLFTTIGINAVSFDLNAGNGTVSVSSTSAQTGEHTSEVDAEVVGEENSILLNHRYVLDGLQHMDGTISFCVNGSDSPCLFRAKGEKDYLYIVMPIRQ